MRLGIREVQSCFQPDSDQLNCFTVVEDRQYLLQAISAQTYGRAISSSGFKLRARFRDWASSELASSTSAEGRLLFNVGSRLSRACSMDVLLIV